MFNPRAQALTNAYRDERKYLQRRRGGEEIYYRIVRQNHRPSHLHRHHHFYYLATNMKRMTFASMTALRAALMNLAEKPPGRALIYGCKGTQRTFCKSVNILRNIKRLSSCSRLEIRGVGFYPDAKGLCRLSQRTVAAKGGFLVELLQRTQLVALQHGQPTKYSCAAPLIRQLLYIGR